MATTSRKPTPSAQSRRPGRPRSETADEAILNAAIELLAVGGPDAATIQAVADRAGVARATIYLRWPGRDALVTAAVRHAIGRSPYALTGDLETDIELGAEQTRAILSEPSFSMIVPTLMRELLVADEAAAGLTFDRLFPNRRLVGEEYRRLASEQGFRTDVEADGVVDLVIGPLLMRLMATARPPTREFTREVSSLVIGALRDGAGGHRRDA
jgi:AcrR family transcriptional regulator